MKRLYHQPICVVVKLATQRPCILLFLVALLLASPSGAVAQRRYGLNHLVDSLLSRKYWSADIDTAYITRPQTRWTVLGRFNLAGARVSAKGIGEGMHFESEMTANNKSTVSFGVSYLGLALNMALNPAKMLGKYHDYELTFRSYGKRMGFDVAYQDASNFKGWQVLDGVRTDFSTSGERFKLRTLNASAYYVFNPRHFSYSAAFAHSYLQRRSAGSFLLAASGQGQHGELKGDVPVRFKMTNIGIGGGYGYNYVPGSGWLLHISALPTFIVYTNTSLTMGGTRIPLDYHFPEVIITGRGAISKQIGTNKFAGLTMVYYFTNIGDEEKLAIHNEKWLARLFFGFRL